MNNNNARSSRGNVFAIISLLLVYALLLGGIFFASEQAKSRANPTGIDIKARERTTLSREGYTLDQVVILSRHNIRAPLSGEGSELGTMTPHKWFDWSAPASQLSVRGGTLETEMGQYFRKWLEKEGLFEENYRPAEGAVRIYANSKQRTIATARFFTAGLLPVNSTEIETHGEYDSMDPTFNPVFTSMSEEYEKSAKQEIIEKFNDTIKSLSDNYALLEKVIDVNQSEAYKAGKFTGFSTEDSEFSLALGKEPAVKGSLKTACQISDALVLQYYEEADKKKATFGHDISEKDWEAISEIKDVYGDVLFTAPSVAKNVAKNLLEEMKKEMTTSGRQFTFLCGHDSNIASVLAAMGVEDYSLPGTIEKKTPIGAKLVLCKWKDASGKSFVSLDIVYQKTEQLQKMTLLGLDNPPAIYTLRLKDLDANKDGLYEESTLLERLG